MKKIITLYCLIFLMSSLAVGQKADPVKWDFSARKINNTTYEIHLAATIDEPYHIYSQATSRQASSPTSVSWEENRSVRFKGKLQEIGELKTEYLEIVDGTLAYYEGKVSFVQVVKVKGVLPVTLRGKINYTACRDEQCLPGKSIDFSVVLK
jgi:thiol:disulfide interchange protein DsbD